MNDIKPVPTPEMITISPASQGRIEIRVSIQTPDDCRTAALWFLDIEERFEAMLNEMRGGDGGA